MRVLSELLIFNKSTWQWDRLFQLNIFPTQKQEKPQWPHWKPGCSPEQWSWAPKNLWVSGSAHLPDSCCQGPRRRTGLSYGPPASSLSSCKNYQVSAVEIRGPTNWWNVSTKFKLLQGKNWCFSHSTAGKNLRQEARSGSLEKNVFSKVLTRLKHCTFRSWNGFFFTFFSHLPGIILPLK